LHIPRDDFFPTLNFRNFFERIKVDKEWLFFNLKTI